MVHYYNIIECNGKVWAKYRYMYLHRESLKTMLLSVKSMFKKDMYNMTIYYKA